VKALYSIGGGDIDPNLFTLMASTASSRQTFIHVTIEVARKYGFDGIDLDWEFLESSKEMDDFAHLLREWRHAVQREARSTNKPPLLLTAAMYYSADFLTYSGGFDQGELGLDQCNVLRLSWIVEYFSDGGPCNIV
jgi:chitinase